MAARRFLGDVIARYLGLGGATPDATNRFAVNSPAILFNHDGAGVQFKTNRKTTSDALEILLQTGLSTRGLIGNEAGSEDLVAKVSPDGSTFHTGMSIDKSTGKVSFPNNASFLAGSWTPALSAYTSAPTGQVLGTVYGNYLQIGKLVYTDFEINVSDKGTGGEGLVYVSGLPKAANSNTYGASLRHAGVNFPGSGAPIMRSSGTTFALYASNGADLLYESHLPTAFSFLGSFIYTTNQ